MSVGFVFRKTVFYLLVLAVVVFAVFPFYYAVQSSFLSGTELFRVHYYPDTLDFKNYITVLTQRTFLRNLANSVFIASCTVLMSLFLAVTASYALARVAFRGRAILLVTILAVSMFPQDRGYCPACSN